MDLRTLRRCTAAAEELHAAGQSLHAVALLHALLRPSIIPPHRRREELTCRVRAAEMLFAMITPQPINHTATAHSESHGSKRGRSAGNNIPASVARLDLVRSVLSPMFSTRRYFENLVIRPLLWGGENYNPRGAGTAAEEEADDDGRVVPVALVVRAYVLCAELHRRRLRYTQAVQYIEAARRWCGVVFAAPITAPGTSTTRQKRQRQEECEEEKRSCEAFLSVELCGVYYAQLMAAGANTTAQYIPNAAAVHSARICALQSILRYAENYAQYTTPTSKALNQDEEEEEEKKKVSAWCLSSLLNSFSIYAAARVLCHFYYTALFLSHQVEAAVAHMRQCEELFGVSPELQCVRDLLTVAHRGVITSSDEYVGVKRQYSSHSSVIPHTDANNSSNNSKKDAALESEITTPSCRMMNLRWVSEGLLLSLRSYITLYIETTAETPSSTLHPRTPCDVWSSNEASEEAEDEESKGRNSVANGIGSERVDYLFQSTLQHIDRQLALLTTSSATALHNSNSSDNEFHLLRSSPSTDIRFLVILKCASLITIISYDLSQLRLTEGLRRLVQLRRYMTVFRKHTQEFCVHYHLLASQLALTLSLRHIEGGESTAPHYTINTTTTATTTTTDGITNQRRLTEKEEEEHTAGFDVGLPYAHIRAAEVAALTAPQPCSPSLLLFLSLMKGAALHHTAHVGAILQLNADGRFMVRDLALHQRYRCGTALANVLEALKTSFTSATTKEEEVQGKEDVEAEVKEDHLRKLRCAWTVSNQLLLLLLRAVTAMTEEKDELTAICTFREALQKAIHSFGTQSRITAECLCLLALAYKEYEQVELQLPTESIRSPTVNASALSCGLARTGEHSVDEAIVTAEDAQQMFLFAWLVASQKSRLAQLHCVLNAQGNSSNEDHRRIVDEWNMEVRHVCSAMQQELMEVLSL